MKRGLLLTSQINSDGLRQIYYNRSPSLPIRGLSVMERRILNSMKTPIQTCFRKISASFRVKNSVSVWKETLII